MNIVYILDMAQIDEDGQPFNRTRVQLGCPEFLEPLVAFAHTVGLGTIVYEADPNNLQRSDEEIERGQQFLSAFAENRQRLLH